MYVIYLFTHHAKTAQKMFTDISAYIYIQLNKVKYNRNTKNTSQNLYITVSDSKHSNSMAKHRVVNASSCKVLFPHDLDGAMWISCSKSVGFGFVVRSILSAILATAIQLSY